jgi:abhydrolase domain-containing protein 17
MGSLFSYSTSSSCCKSIDDTIEQKIFHPPMRNDSDFGDLNSKQTTLLEYYTKKEQKISAIRIMPEGNTHPEKYIVYSHGNGCDILDANSFCKNLANNLNVGVICYDYIGYGLSEKISPSEQGCYDSIEATIDFMIYKLEINPKRIYLMGQSLGTGITIDYISKHDWITPVILISPYKSICKVVVNTSIISPIDKFKSQKKLVNIKCPIKIFHGVADEIIGINHGIAMYNSLQNKTFAPVWFEGIGHNDILDSITHDYYLEVLNYQF